MMELFLFGGDRDTPQLSWEGSAAPRDSLAAGLALIECGEKKNHQGIKKKKEGKARVGSEGDSWLPAALTLGC